MFVAAALIARHNLRKGRGDRRGAFQLAAFVSLAAVGVWLLDASTSPIPTRRWAASSSGQPLWAAGMLWLLYLALEPYVRRFWPATLVSWSRLMARQWRDPLVGRDILFGVALGALIPVLGCRRLLRSPLGYPVPPRVPDWRLLGTAAVAGATLNQVVQRRAQRALRRLRDGAAEDAGPARAARPSVVAIGLVTLSLAGRGIFDGGARRAINLVVAAMR